MRPRLASLLAGRVEAEAITLRGVRVAPGPGGEELRRLVADRPRRGKTEPGAARSAPFPRFSVRDAWVEWPGGEAEGMGPFSADIDAERTPDGVSGTVRLGLPGGGGLDVRLEPAAGDTAFRLTGRASLRDDVPPAIADRLPVSFPSGTLSLRGSGSVAADLGSAEATLELGARDVAVAGRLVGPAPLGPLDAGASGRVTWSGAERRVDLAGGKVWLGGSGEVAAALSGEVTMRAEPRFSLTAVADAVPWRALLESVPPDLAPPSSVPVLSGALSARAHVSGSLSRRREWDVSVDLDLDDLRRAARAAGPTWLSGPFEWKPIDPAPDEPARRIAVGPGNPAFLPYAETPPHVVRAVTASEDAGFFAHRGFDFREIANAIAERGRVRGASTISQQLAKNLFLSPERTLSRKVREALGTIALEASVGKARLLEIYLNIAEWGPGVYGIGEAARFWFDKDPRALTPRESAFLATVIPAPRRFHARLHRSGITPWWNARIDDVLGKMRVQGALDDAQLAAALAEPLSPVGRLHPVGEPAGPGPGSGAVSEPEPAEDEPASDRPSGP